MQLKEVDMSTETDSFIGDDKNIPLLRLRKGSEGRVEFFIPGRDNPLEVNISSELLEVLVLWKGYVDDRETTLGYLFRKRQRGWTFCYGEVCRNTGVHVDEGVTIEDGSVLNGSVFLDELVAGTTCC